MSISCLNPENPNVISLISGSRKNFPMFRTDQIVAVASIYYDKFNKLPSPEELLDFYASIQPKTPKELFKDTNVTDKQDIVDLLQGVFFIGLGKITGGKYLTKATIAQNKDKILNKMLGFLKSVGLNTIAENYDVYKEFLKSRLSRLNIDVDFDLEVVENQASKDNNWDRDSTFTDNYARATDETIYLFASLTGDELIKGVPKPLPLHTTWNIVQNLLAGTSDIDTQIDILRNNLPNHPFIYQILDKLGYGNFEALSELDYSSVRTSFTGSFSKTINSLMMGTTGKQTYDNVDSTTKLGIKAKWKSNFRQSEYNKVIGNRRVFNPDKIDELLNESDNEKFLNNLGIYLDNYEKVSRIVADIKKYFLQKVKEDNVYSWLDEGKFVSARLKELQDYQLRFIKETKATGARNANGEYQHAVGLHSYISKKIGNLRNQVTKPQNKFEKLFADGIATLGISQGLKNEKKESSTFDSLSKGDIYNAIISDMFSSTPFIHLPRTSDKKEEKGIKLEFDRFKNPTISAKDYYDTIMAYTKISPELYNRLREQYILDSNKVNNPKWGSKTQEEPIEFWNQLLNIPSFKILSQNEFKAGVDKYIENQVQSLYDDLFKYKVITNSGNYVYTTFPKSFMTEEKRPLVEEDVKNLLRNYIFNSLLFGTEMTQMQFGSLTTASPEEFFKRTAGPIASGKIPRTDDAIVNKLLAQRGEEMKNFSSPAVLKVSISKDDMYDSKNAKKYNKEGNTKAYSKNNVNDGQGDIIFQSYREYKSMLEEWSDIQEEAWKKMQRGERLDEKRFNNLFPPIKPVGFSLVMIDGVEVPIYIKTSIYPIYPTFSKGTMNEVAYNSMLENGISINLPLSGIKIAKAKMAKDKFEEGKFVINEDAIFEFPTSDLLSQLDIQVKDSVKQLIATQQQKLIAVNMYNNGGVIDKDFENWVEERKDTIEKLAEIETKKLEEKAGIEMQDGIPVINDYTKLAQMLRDELLSRDMPINTIDAIDSIIGPDGRLLNTIDALPSRQKLMNLLNSIVTNKLIKLYTNGSALVQVAQTGWEMTKLPNGDKATDAEILAIDCAIDFVNNDAKIAYYRNNGLSFLELPAKKKQKTGAAEILLPAKFKKYVDADGNIDTRLLINIGYRIPTQGLNSILHLKVVGFLSPGLDQMVVMPREITTQGGSDFDVDKLNIFMPNSIKIKGEVKYISKDMNAAEIFEDKKQSLKNTIEFFNQKIEKYYSKVDKAAKKDQEYISDELLEETLENSEIGGDLEMLEIETIFSSKDSTIEKYQKIYDELSTYMTKEGRQKWIGKFEKAQLQNEMIEQTIKVLEHPNSVKSLLTPNDSNELKELAEGLSTKVTMSETFMPKTLADITYQMFSAKALVGIFASQSTHHALAQQVGLHFKSGRKFYFAHNTIKVDGKLQPSLAGVTTKNTYKIISDRLGNQYITASVDAAKDPFLFYLGCNLDTGGIFALVERLGGDIEYLVNLIKQPVVQRYLLAMSNNNQLSNDYKTSKSNIIKYTLNSIKDVTEEDSEFIQDYYKDTEKSRARTEYLRELRETAKDNPTEVMMLDDFLYLSDAASTLTQSIANIKFDTSGPGKDAIQSVLMNENYLAFNRKMSDNVKYTMATVKNGEQLPYSRIVTDTILEVFYKRSAGFVIDLYKDLIALHSNFEFTTILKEFNNPMSSFVNGKLDEESATLLYGTMVNYVMQKTLGSIGEDKELFFGKNTNAIKVLKIQKDPTHPLHNNYILTNVFNPEIGVRTTNPDILTLINKNVDNREQSYILGAFAEIKKIDPELYYDLIRANFYQTGVVQSPASYYNLLPNTDVVPLANSLLKNHAEITSGKIFPLMDAIMANIGMSLNNVKRVSSKKSDVFSSRMIFKADRSAKKEYIYYKERYDSSNKNAVLREGIFKKVGDSSYELLEPQNYRSMFYNLDLAQDLDLNYRDDLDLLEENPFIESEEDDLPPTQPSTSVKPTIDTVREWSGDLKTRPVYTPEGVNTMRTEVANKDEHFGNPFSEAGYGSTIKVPSIGAAVIAYKEWLLGTNHEDVKPQQREWILDQINQGKLDGATLLYAGKSAARGQGMHPTALAEVVEQLRSIKKGVEISSNVKIEYTPENITSLKPAEIPTTLIAKVNSINPYLLNNLKDGVAVNLDKLHVGDKTNARVADKLKEEISEKYTKNITDPYEKKIVKDNIKKIVSYIKGASFASLYTSVDSYLQNADNFFNVVSKDLYDEIFDRSNYYERELENLKLIFIDSKTNKKYDFEYQSKGYTSPIAFQKVNVDVILGKDGKPVKKDELLEKIANGDIIIDYIINEDFYKEKVPNEQKRTVTSKNLKKEDLQEIINKEVKYLKTSIINKNIYYKYFTSTDKIQHLLVVPSDGPAQLQAPVNEAAPVLNNKIEPGRYVNYNNEIFIVTKININDTIQIYNPTLEGTAAKKSVAMRNLKLLNSKAEIVKHKESSYIVTPKETIISLTSNKVMKWGEENGDRKEILLKSKDKATTEYSAWNEISEEDRNDFSKLGYIEETFNNLTIEEQNLLFRCRRKIK